MGERIIVGSGSKEIFKVAFILVFSGGLYLSDYFDKLGHPVDDH